MKARKMFEDLGWKFCDDDGNISYDLYVIDKVKGCYESISCIYFNKDTKTYSSWTIMREEESILYLDIKPELHKAIDKQMRELEWI